MQAWFHHRWSQCLSWEQGECEMVWGVVWGNSGKDWSAEEALQGKGIPLKVLNIPNRTMHHVCGWLHGEEEWRQVMVPKQGSVNSMFRSFSCLYLYRLRTFWTAADCRLKEHSGYKLKWSIYLCIYLSTKLQFLKLAQKSDIRLVKFQTWVKLPNIVKLADTY